MLQVLLYHVLPVPVTAEQAIAAAGTNVTTLLGQPLFVSAASWRAPRLVCGADLRSGACAVQPKSLRADFSVYGRARRVMKCVPAAVRPPAPLSHAQPLPTRPQVEVVDGNVTFVPTGGNPATVLIPDVFAGEGDNAESLVVHVIDTVSFSQGGGGGC